VGIENRRASAVRPATQRQRDAQVVVGVEEAELAEGVLVATGAHVGEAKHVAHAGHARPLELLLPDRVSDLPSRIALS